jgi:predicted deacylase
VGGEHAGQITALRDDDFLRWRYLEGTDTSRARSQPPERQAALRAASFLRRVLPRAVGVWIDRHALLPTRK